MISTGICHQSTQTSDPQSPDGIVLTSSSPAVNPEQTSHLFQQVPPNRKSLGSNELVTEASHHNSSKPYCSIAPEQTASSRNRPVIERITDSLSTHQFMQRSAVSERLSQSQKGIDSHLPHMSASGGDPVYKQCSKIPESDNSISQDSPCPIILDQEQSPRKDQDEEFLEGIEDNPSLVSRSFYHYKLPTFPTDIVEQIDQGRPIEARDRSRLLETLYESAVPYTYYPSSTHYKFLLNTFLERFPQLLSHGSSSDDGLNWDAWRQKLMHMFKNKRRRKDRGVLEVQQRTHKNSSSLEEVDELEQSKNLDAGDVQMISHWSVKAKKDEIFNVEDDDDDEITLKDKISACHVMAADTTDEGESPGKGQVQESGSSYLHNERSDKEPLHSASKEQHSLEPQMETSRLSEGRIPRVQLQNQHDKHKHPFMSRLRNNPSREFDQQSPSLMHTFSIPESTLSSSIDHVPSIDEEQLSNREQEKTSMQVHHLKRKGYCDPKKPLIGDYELPKFPSDIIQKLQHRVQLDRQEKSMILDILYESIVPYTFYPTAADYRFFTNMLLEKHPQLLTQTGSNNKLDDNWEAWRQKLIHKFQNSRKRRDKAAPEVQQRTHKRFRHNEGIDEFQTVSLQVTDYGGNSMDRNYLLEADNDDDKGLEVVEDADGIFTQGERSAYHVMAADTSNVHDIPNKRVIQDSIPGPSLHVRQLTKRSLASDNTQSNLSSSHSPNIPAANILKLSEKVPFKPSTSQMQKNPDIGFIRESSTSQSLMTSIPETESHHWQEFTQPTSVSPLSTNQEKEPLNSQSMDLVKAPLHDYKLPKFAPYIVQKLECGIPIDRQDTSVLLDTLYESVVQYTFYPSAGCYLYITNLLLDQFPQLLAQAGSIQENKDNREAWRQKIMHKFKNMRKRRDKAAPEVQQRTRKGLKYCEGMDESETVTLQVTDYGGDSIDRDYLLEAGDGGDDDGFEIVDDADEILVKEEECAYHVMAADTTHVGDIPDREDALSTSSVHTNQIHQRLPSDNLLNIPVRDIVKTSDKVPSKQITSHSEKNPDKDFIHESSSSQSVIPETCQEFSPPTSVSPLNTNQGKEPLNSQSIDLVKPPLHDYKLPKFAPYIVQKLECGIQIDRQDTSVLLDTLYESVVQHTYYPSASCYLYITNLLLDQFPQLLPQVTSIQENADNREAWRQKLMHKFKNMRKRRDKAAPEVQQRTRKGSRHINFQVTDYGEGGSFYSDHYVEAKDDDDDDGFEIVDDADEILVKEEECAYHVMAADTTHVGDIPDREDALSTSSVHTNQIHQRLPSDNLLNIPVRDIVKTSDKVPSKQITSHSEKNPDKDFIHESSSSQSVIPETCQEFSPPTSVSPLNTNQGKEPLNSQSIDLVKPPLHDYKLPKFAPYIVQKLECGIQIDRQDTSVLLDTLYESVVQHTYYPSASCYLYITNLLLDQFPQLLPQVTSIQENADNREAWRQKLMHKFKNMRKRRDKAAPEVQQRTRKGSRHINFQVTDYGEGGSFYSDHYVEAKDDDDDDGFEIVDDADEILIMDEDSAAHVMAADTTDVSDILDKSVSTSLHTQRFSQRNVQSEKVPSRTSSFQDPALDILKPSDMDPTNSNTSSSQEDTGIDSLPESSNSQFYKHASGIPETPSHKAIPTTIIFTSSMDHGKGESDIQGMESDGPSLCNYQLPSFPPSIVQKLQCGMAIDRQDRSLLLETLYESVVQYTYYPSPAEYLYITNLLLEQFPQLVPQAGPIQNCPDHQEAWRQKIMHKFKNMRKRRDKAAPEVQQRTRKSLQHTDGMNEPQTTRELSFGDEEQVIRNCLVNDTDDNDDVFEVLDDVTEIVIKQENFTYDSGDADTTNFDGT